VRVLTGTFFVLQKLVLLTQTHSHINDRIFKRWEKKYMGNLFAVR